MRNAAAITAKHSRLFQRFYSLQGVAAPREIDILRGPLESIDLHEFRHKAFIPQTPILITTKGDSKTSSADPRTLACSITAAVKWFEQLDSESELSSQASILSQHYLSPFGATILPYEYIVDKNHTSVIDNGTGSQDFGGESQELSEILENLSKGSSDGAFHRFNAPLALFLQTCKLKSKPRLYIAQAQIADLPKQLRDDLHTPRLVKEAGRGDVYDANIWVGIPPTYTPLHKDPNPNLFVQLASSKSVRIFRPSVGASIFREVQLRIGQTSSSTLRGEEMMEGPERDALDEVTWGEPVGNEGYEVVVRRGDALFIPKGWWHSIKSIGTGVNASANWWFR